MWMSDIAAILSKEFKPQGYKIPSMKVPKFLLRVVGLWDAAAAAVVSSIGKQIKYDNTRAREMLGMTFIPSQKSVIDMAYSLIDLGIVPDKRAGARRGTV